MRCRMSQSHLCRYTVYPSPPGKIASSKPLTAGSKMQPTILEGMGRNAPGAATYGYPARQWLGQLPCSCYGSWQLF
jgi:hypothetical protein